MTREEREDAIKFFEEVAKREVNNAKYSKLAIEALEQKPKIKVLDRDEVIRKLGAVDVYQACAWITLFKDLEFLKLKICEEEE